MVAGMEAFCQGVRKTLFHGMPPQHEKVSCGEGFAWVNRLSSGGETAFQGALVAVPWQWRPFVSRKGSGDRLGPCPLPNNQTFLPALEMRGCGPSHVGFPNQDTNQDTAPPQPFQPIVKRPWA